MKEYKHECLWIRQNDDGTVDVGFSRLPVDPAGTRPYLEVSDGNIILEGAKSTEEIEIPVKGTILFSNVDIYFSENGEFDRNMPLIKFDIDAELTGIGD